MINGQTNILVIENLEPGIPVKSSEGLSIIIPVYNEAQVIKKNLEQVIEGIKQFFIDYQIIIAEDGSDDGTDSIIKQLAENNPQITHLHFDMRLGKGLAIKRSIKIAKEKIIAFMDADLSIPIKHLPSLVQMINQGCTMAIGSRAIKGSLVKRPPIRKIASKIYNLTVRLLFKDGIHDHQCGFKAFNRDHILPLINEIDDKGFFFDTELIIKTKMKGCKITEIPIIWEEPKDRISKFQLVQDGIKILVKLLKLRINLWKG